MKEGFSCELSAASVLSSWGLDESALMKESKNTCPLQVPLLMLPPEQPGKKQTTNELDLGKMEEQR